MAKEMDKNDIWIQSLGLLFVACEPLTYDCLRSKEENKILQDNISTHVYYCSSVKRDIGNGKVPKTWDQWIDSHNKFNELVNSDNKAVEASVVKPINNIDVRSFSDLLTRIFE
jgi:hypothetical protein